MESVISPTGVRDCLFGPEEWRTRIYDRSAPMDNPTGRVLQAKNEADARWGAEEWSWGDHLVTGEQMIYPYLNEDVGEFLEGDELLKAMSKLPVHRVLTADISFYVDGVIVGEIHLERGDFERVRVGDEIDGFVIDDILQYDEASNNDHTEIKFKISVLAHPAE